MAREHGIAAEDSQAQLKADVHDLDRAPMESDASDRPSPVPTTGMADDDYTLVCMADVPPAAIDWLWPDRIALGKLTIIAGNGGLGKSTLALSIAAILSTGRAWPDRPDLSAEIGSTVILSAEDGLDDTVRPRLDAAGADVSKVFALETVKRPDGTLAPFSLKRDIPKLERAIQQAGNARLVIIDPVSAYTGDTDDHKNAAVRGLLGPLAEMAHRLGVAIVLVTHLNKNAGGKSHTRILGSTAYYAAARTVWMVIQDPKDPTRVLMLFGKSNISASRSGLAFRIVDGAIRWEDAPIEMTADEILATESDATKSVKREDRAVGFLRTLLADGRVPSTEVYERGKQAGFSEGSLQRAKAKAGVEFQREGYGRGGKCYWALVDALPCTPEEAPSPGIGIHEDYERNGPDEEGDRHAA